MQSANNADGPGTDPTEKKMPTFYVVSFWIVFAYLIQLLMVFHAATAPHERREIPVKGSKDVVVVESHYQTNSVGSLIPGLGLLPFVMSEFEVVVKYGDYRYVYDLDEFSDVAWEWYRAELDADGMIVVRGDVDESCRFPAER